ncbi:MAG TPA: hypothetical protein VJ792_04290 [Candidatus Nitrosotalea sp.]|nr:hypothetical protein [Candidatus Nitrosotalea sp.]
MNFDPRRFNTGAVYNRPKSRFRLSGHVEAYMFDAKKVPTFDDYLRLRQRNELEKFVLWKDKGDNLVVNAGLARIILLLNAGSTTAFGSCGVGSGTNNPAPTDTDLQTAITRITVTNITQSANVGYWNTFFSSAVGNGTWNETGLFDTNTLGSGTMLCRKLFSSSFPKTSLNTATIAWQLTVTAV